MADLADAGRQFADLAKNLRYVGEEGLRKELYKAISDATEPLAREIKGVTHLRDYMPNRYADVLAGDLKVTTSKRTGADPGVTIVARAPTGGRGGRKIRQREAGVITHPVFGNRKNWKTQTAGMKPGFFADPVDRAAPALRERLLEAIRRAEDQALGRP